MIAMNMSEKGEIQRTESKDRTKHVKEVLFLYSRPCGADGNANTALFRALSAVNAVDSQFGFLPYDELIQRNTKRHVFRSSSLVCDGPISDIPLIEAESQLVAPERYGVIFANTNPTLARRLERINSASGNRTTTGYDFVSPELKRAS